MVMSRLIRIHTVCHYVLGFVLSSLFLTTDMEKFKDERVKSNSETKDWKGCFLKHTVVNKMHCITNVSATNVQNTCLQVQRVRLSKMKSLPAVLLCIHTSSMSSDVTMIEIYKRVHQYIYYVGNMVNSPLHRIRTKNAQITKCIREV